MSSSKNYSFIRHRLVSFIATLLTFSLIVSPIHLIHAEENIVITTDDYRISGELKKWFPLTLDFFGPQSSETSADPNPFLDYRLNVTFKSPSGKEFVVPGFFDGNGNGNGTGNIWRVRFSPSESGTWNFTASFRQGDNIAVSLDNSAGSAHSFNSTKGSVSISGRDSYAPGFLSQGRLQYVGEHYLKFADGNYFIKGGAGSPENFLAYQGFDNTKDYGNLPGGNFLHSYSKHVSDWKSGDPDWNSGKGKGIIGALNYLSSQNVNSIYFLPMNLGGDGQDVHPFVDGVKSSFNVTHYDISKLYQWNTVFNHAQRKGIQLHMLFAETENANEQWLDNGSFGTQRKLYFRELIARFGYILGIKWDLSEENDFSVDTLRNMADYISKVDPYDHPITVHTDPNNFKDYEALKGDHRFSATAIQYDPAKAGQHVETWRTKSTDADRKWVLDMDENNPANTGLSTTNADELRKQVLYSVIFSGGNIEWYAGYYSTSQGGGDMNLEDFRTREKMWKYTWYARKVLLEHMPFVDMQPNDGLLTGAISGNHVFAKQGSAYALYLKDANPSGTLDLSNYPGNYELRWYNPRNGNFEGNTKTIAGGKKVPLGSAPSDKENDWVVIVKKK